MQIENLKLKRWPTNVERDWKREKKRKKYSFPPVAVLLADRSVNPSFQLFNRPIVWSSYFVDRSIVRWYRWCRFDRRSNCLWLVRECPWLVHVGRLLFLWWGFNPTMFFSFCSFLFFLFFSFIFFVFFVLFLFFSLFLFFYSFFIFLLFFLWFFYSLCDFLCFILFCFWCFVVFLMFCLFFFVFLCCFFPFFLLCRFYFALFILDLRSTCSYW